MGLLCTLQATLLPPGEIKHGCVDGVGRSGMGVVMVLVDQAWVCRLLVMVQVYVR